jgi:hypothetical protein
MILITLLPIITSFLFIQHKQLFTYFTHFYKIIKLLSILRPVFIISILIVSFQGNRNKFQRCLLYTQIQIFIFLFSQFRQNLFLNILPSYNFVQDSFLNTIQYLMYFLVPKVFYQVVILLVTLK